MIKVAIVGTNGLAQLVAHYLSTTTSHQFVFLSRRPNSGLTAKGWQVLPVDYQEPSDLRFKLAGVDTVISTVSGSAQLALVDAAAAAGVRRFATSEFGGSPTSRPAEDLLDNGHHAAILKLSQFESSGMSFTVFTCGLFYERFGPGGLAASQLGLNSNISGEGDYIINFRQRKARLPYNDTSGRAAYICLTSARDVAQFVVAALDLAFWPREFRLRGERMRLTQLIAIAEQVRGKPFETSRYSRRSLMDGITYARAVRDAIAEAQLHYLMATAEGRFDFTDTNLNQLINIRPETFREYLVRAWSNTS